MSKSYARNIQRLKAAESRHSQEEQKAILEKGKAEGDWRIEHVRQITEGLKPFSKELKEWKKRDIEKQKAAGVAAARQARLEKAKMMPEHAKKLQAIEEARKVGELAYEFEDAKAQDLAYHKLKKEMLQAGGTKAYPDADRLAQLSPWQQVGFAQEKLRVFNESFEDKLAHAMQNSEEQITLSGITFTPSEIKDNNMAYPMKEAAIEVLAEDIRKAQGIDRFSPEMLKLSKTEDAIQKAKDSQLGKYRERYNIDSSIKTRQKAKLEWSRSEKLSTDLEKLLLVNSATVDTEGKLVGNAGAWKEVEKILIEDGINVQDSSYANRILDQPMSDNMCRELGVKKGTTFSQQWPSRTKEIKRKIREGWVKEVNDEEKFLEAAGTDKTNEFIKEARENPDGLTSQRVNEYKAQFGELGLPIPSAITNYETVSDRNEREDKELIEALLASQNGYISNEQLDAFHPKAALEYREKATKLEEGALKKHDAEKKIKAHMDTAFTNMGIKANEKSPAYVEAMANAKADYALKYNNYIAMGYNSAQASHLALHAQQVTDKQTGEIIPDSMGVLTEIRTNGEGSKYVQTGQSVEKELKAGHLRVARIYGAKQEILNDASSVTTKVIGGDYGHRQITTIADNVQKHGRRGLYMDQGALAYYKGIARGRNAREGGWWGLVDAQLKAAGHEGLNPAERPKAMELLTGEDANGNTIPDPRGTKAIDRRVSRAMSYPSQQAALFAAKSLEDCQRFGRGGCIWDLPENLPLWRVPPITGFPTLWPQIPLPEQRWPGSPPFNPNATPLFYKDGGNI